MALYYNNTNVHLLDVTLFTNKYGLQLNMQRLQYRFETPTLIGHWLGRNK